MRAFARLQPEFLFGIDPSPIARRQCRPIQVQVPGDQLKPGMALVSQLVPNLSVGCELTDKEQHILVDPDGTLAAVGGTGQRESVRWRLGK